MTRLAATLVLALALATPGAALAEAEMLGRWQGTYKCNQGWTGVDLVIEEDTQVADALEGGPDAKRLKASFAFYEIARNPGVPSGRFTMRGWFSPGKGELSLVQERWIDRPVGYVMVDLHGDFDAEEDVLVGRVDGFNCGPFEIRRAEGPPQADSWLTGK